MQSTLKQEQTMSSPSRPETEAVSAANGHLNLTDAVVKFDEKDFEHFHVEYRDDGDDVLYHFWPPREDQSFAPEFALHLEAAFQSVLPEGAEVHASYTDLAEATVKMNEGFGLVSQRDFAKPEVLPRETFYVRVLGAYRYPMANAILKNRVFEVLEANL
jgi:hypothetical protein